MKKTRKSYLPTIHLNESNKDNPEVLRIILSNESTQIDFGYVAPWIYVRGGWIRIAPYTFLRVQGSDKRYLLKEARNITLAPTQHHFESNEDWKVFSLIFEPIPLCECLIDIVEEEHPDENDFNFYGIHLSKVTETCILE